MKLEHVVIKSGRKTFRRRIPQDLRKVIPKTFFQAAMSRQAEGVALVREHAALMDAFQRLVSDTRSGSLERTPEQYVEEALTSLGDPMPPRR
ncbi:hypothetical protein [Roseobacter fucihabitans]|nr:hypothetical protein [Roseobacter litoralis]